ncbi:MAG: TolC family protein [Deltaproteobacteria bacterium]|nr:TolC family protein [Deltaproteobacteria bacterium]
MNALVAILAALATGGTPTDPPNLRGMPQVVAMSLPEALAEIDRQNPTLEEARARATAALGVVRQAAAPLLPTLQAGGGYFHNNAEAVFLRPTTPTTFEKVYIQPLDAWQAGGALRVPLVVPDAWFSLSASREAALAAAAASDATRLSVRMALLQTAWTAWAGDEIVDASERAVANARSQAESSRRQVKAGTAAPLTVLQADTAATRRESDLLQARSERSRARIAVGVLLGRPDPVLIAMPPLPAPSAYDVADLSRQALDARPELRAQAAVVRSYEKQASASLWRIAPQISASGSGMAQTVPYPTGDKQGWRVSVDLTWTLYDGGFRYGKADQASAQASEARAAETGTRLQILQEVQNSARDVEVARQRLALAQQEKDTASEAAASARRGFGEGVTSSLDVLSANEMLFFSEVQVASAGARLGGSLAALDRAVGRSP